MTAAYGPATSDRGADRSRQRRSLLFPWDDVRISPPITAVMKGCGQLSCDGHPLVPQPRAEPSFPPPPRGACIAFDIHHVNRYDKLKWLRSRGDNARV